jgi:hypothetical protein
MSKCWKILKFLVFRKFYVGTDVQTIPRLDFVLATSTARLNMYMLFPMRYLSVSILVFSLVAQNMDTDPCIEMEMTTACSEGLPVFGVMNDVIVSSPKMDCLAWEMVGDAIHLGVSGLIDWEQACSGMPFDEEGRQRPRQPFQSQIDIVECRVFGNLTIKFADNEKSYQHDTLFGIENCTHSTMNMPDFLWCNENSSYPDVCHDGKIDRRVFDVLDRSDCNAEILRNILFQDGLKGLNGWIFYCRERQHVFLEGE